MSYISAPLPPPDTPWREAAYCVLDLETTGLDARRDEIVSYAAVPIDDARVRVAGTVEGLVRTAGPIPGSSVRIHGIRSGDVTGAPTLDEALDRLIAALTGRVLVVHVDWVERGFLGPALARRGLQLREPVLDTARLASAWLGELPDAVSLPWLAQKLGLPVYHRHEALGDALTTAQVFLALASLLDRREPQTVGSLSAAGVRPARGGLLRRVGRRRPAR
jgi:DNA polymerase-3 subunit epsilon